MTTHHDPDTLITDYQRLVQATSGLSKRQKAEVRKKWLLRECCKCGHGPVKGVAKIIDTSGRERYPYICEKCGTRTTVFCPKNEVPQAIKDSPPVFAYELQLGECERCGAYTHVENHHWAPRYLFGDACDEWPTSQLCRACHKEWHDAVTPNMSSASNLSAP